MCDCDERYMEPMTTLTRLVHSLQRISLPAESTHLTYLLRH